MSGSIFSNINPATTSGTQLSTLLNSFKDIVVSGFIGTARPANLLSGGYWIDSTNEGSPNFSWDMKIYTGTQDISLFKINIQTLAASFDGAENIFKITKKSDDDLGPIIRFIKERILGNGQTLLGDTVLKFEGQGRTDSGAAKTLFEVEIEALENTTATQSGSQAIIRLIPSGASALSDLLFLRGGKIGVGNPPIYSLDVKGDIASNVVSDDDIAPKTITIKKRVTNNGQVLTNDRLKETIIQATTDSGAQVTAYKEVVTSNSNVTGLLCEAEIQSFFQDDAGVLVMSKKETGKELSLYKNLALDSLQFAYNEVVSQAEFLSLLSLKAVCVLTGITAFEIKGIDVISSNFLIIQNNTNKIGKLANNSLDVADTTKRIILQGSVDLVINPYASVSLFYDTQALKWKVVGSSSGGFWSQEAPTGLINGANLVYSITNEALDLNSFQLFLNGLLQIPTIDYSLSATTITFTQAPASGSKLWAQFIKKGV